MRISIETYREEERGISHRGFKICAVSVTKNFYIYSLHRDGSGTYFRIFIYIIEHMLCGSGRYFLLCEESHLATRVGKRQGGACLL